ncbi:MAG: valine--tRNA ligase [Rhabdochlamydiaceae bacterium]
MNEESLMSDQKEIPKSYEAHHLEQKWRDFWIEHRCFEANPLSNKTPYSLIMPPPNVTGVLHMGHALVNTLQDILVRWKKMNGFETFWIPGTDHAGIATQTVVEKNLIAKEGKRRFEYTREDFLSRVWDWKEESEKHILSQLKKLGCGCDWSHLAFSMDKKRNKAVATVFKKMFDDGLIYRGDYLVNWDPYTQTALADDEVEYEERKGFLYLIRYLLEEDKSQFIVVATTRPETLFGDVAVAVSPKDNRYQHLIGKKLLLPLTNRVIPVISDSFVDPEFGTGAVKVTPAHDPNDYEIGLRHHLPMINMMTPDGKINQEGGTFFSGLNMEEGRAAVVQELKKQNLCEGAIPHLNRVGVSYRSKATIEPYLSKQWFIKMSYFKQTLKDVVKNKEVKLIPSHWEQTYFHWIDNLRDWCISRQLWWGHRLPIWYNRSNPEKIICFIDEGLPPEVLANPAEWKQEEDVLDTWFSSALWPFSTLGWPEKTPELSTFYPNATLITGHDILFFWVARMIMMGTYVLGSPPFAHTFTHGLVYGKSYWRTDSSGQVIYVTGQERKNYDMGHPLPVDIQSKWEKMSKSKGNVIDPLEIIDFYGTDAMRLTLSSSTTYARQIDLDMRRFEEQKNFVNKVWNASRYVLLNISDLPKELKSGLNPSLYRLEDEWILKRLKDTIKEVNHSLEAYAFDKTSQVIYRFFWDEFCSYYLELSKPFLAKNNQNKEIKENKQKLFLVILTTIVRLLHPFAPFITEEIFSLLKSYEFFIKEKTYVDPLTLESIEALSSPCCVLSSYPKADLFPSPEEDIDEAFRAMEELSHVIRNIRAEMQLPPQTTNDLIFISSSKELEFVQKNIDFIKALIKIDKITYSSEEISLPLSATGIAKQIKILIPLPQEMKEKEKLRLTKQRNKLIEQQVLWRNQLANPDFSTKAPPALVAKTQNSIKESEEQLIVISQKLMSLMK